MHFCSTYPGKGPCQGFEMDVTSQQCSDWHEQLLHIPEVEKAFYLSLILHVDDVFFIKI